MILNKKEKRHVKAFEIYRELITKIDIQEKDIEKIRKDLNIISDLSYLSAEIFIRKEKEERKFDY